MCIFSHCPKLVSQRFFCLLVQDGLEEIKDSLEEVAKLPHWNKAVLAELRLKKTPAIQFIQSIPSTWKGHELFAIWIVKTLKPKVVVDLGFDMGLSTIALAHRNRGDTFGIDWVEQNFSRKKVSLDSAF